MEPTETIRTALRARRTARAIRSLAPALLVVLVASPLLASPASASSDLVILPEVELLAVMIVGFALLIFPVNQLIFKPIFRALDDRAERIDGSRSRASQIQGDADAVLADYEARIREAWHDADAARKDSIAAARTEHTTLTAAARSDAERRIDEARATLSRDLESAREQMRTEAQQLARAAAEQILGRSVS